MPHQRLTLACLEHLLLTTCDDLRGNMDAMKAQLREARGLTRLAKKDTSFGDWKAHQAEGLRPVRS
jgi:hypothetical protein